MTSTIRCLRCCVVAAILLSAVPAVGQSPAIGPSSVARQVVIVTATADDPRIALTRAALEFWNQTLSDVGVGIRFAEATVAVGVPGVRAIETYARFVAQRGGRIPKGTSGPQPPPALRAIGGDVVLLLSRQPLLPFAWPLVGSPDYFVVIRAPDRRRTGDTRVLRNIIAHELGHTLGLIHHRASFTLMCGPCSSIAAADDRLEWLPLTDVDLERLQAIHAPR
ncbi:MAG: hypothetical protein OSB03_03835 [Vicinamibacterales bacterium]|nr:hypothetical protein [Vicinamibacterales bacterium]